MAIKPTGALLLLAFTASAAAVEKAVEVGPALGLQVSYGAGVPTPVRYVSSDYDGPYNPLDPKGVVAAHNRELSIAHKQNAALAKSYIPPGLDKVVKKEVIKLAVDEGRRFAFSHPKETGDLIAIVNKAKDFYSHAEKKVEKLEKEERKKEEAGN